MEWVVGLIVVFFISKSLSKKKNKPELGQFGQEQQGSGLFMDLEKILKDNRIKALKKEKILIDKRIAMEQELINKMDSLTKKIEKTPVEHIAEAKAKADVLSLKIIKSEGRKKKDLEFKRSQEIENQKYWIRRVLA